MKKKQQETVERQQNRQRYGSHSWTAWTNGVGPYMSRHCTRCNTDEMRSR